MVALSPSTGVLSPNVHPGEVTAAAVRGLDVPLVGQLEDADGDEGGDEEGDVKPPVVEVELEVAQDLGHNSPDKHLLVSHTSSHVRSFVLEPRSLPVLHWHVHSHEQHHRDKVHPHELGEEEHDQVGAPGARDPDEELGHGQQEATDGRHHDAAHLV